MDVLGFAAVFLLLLVWFGFFFPHGVKVTKLSFSAARTVKVSNMAANTSITWMV